MALHALTTTTSPERQSAPGLAPLRVLLLDDDALFRRGLRNLLDGDEVAVVGEASPAGAVAKILSLRPSAVLLGLSRVSRDGSEILRRIHEASPGLPVLVLGASRDPADVLAAVTAESSGFVVKDASIEEIVRGLRAAASGEVYLSPVVTRGVLNRVRPLIHSTRSAGASHLLTDRENEVLRLMAHGLENSDIAAKLAITVRTVKAHVSSILDKLGVENRVQAAVIALGAGHHSGARPGMPGFVSARDAAAQVRLDCKPRRQPAGFGVD